MFLKRKLGHWSIHCKLESKSSWDLRGSLCHVANWWTAERQCTERLTSEARVQQCMFRGRFETDGSRRLWAQCFCHCEETSHWSSLRKNVWQLTVLENNSRTWGMRQLVPLRLQSGSRWWIPLLSSFLPVQDRTMLSIQGGPAQICLI